MQGIECKLQIMFFVCLQPSESLLENTDQFFRSERVIRIAEMTVQRHRFSFRNQRTDFISSHSDEILLYALS